MKDFVVLLVISLILIWLIFISGCSLPMSGEELSKALAALSVDNASACISMQGGGGGGVVAVTPIPIPGGGYGQGSIVACRSNQPGSEIKVDSTGMVIRHGEKK